MRKALAIIAVTAVLATPMVPKKAPAPTLPRDTATTQGLGAWVCDWFPMLCS